MNTTILLAAICTGLTLLAYYLHGRAVNAERQAECWQREARAWEETADRARGFAQDAIDTLAARQNELDVRDAQIDQLRQVRHDYIEHLVTGSCRSVAELRREIGRN